jgi:hypothetical protein
LSRVDLRSGDVICAGSLVITITDKIILLTCDLNCRMDEIGLFVSFKHEDNHLNLSSFTYLYERLDDIDLSVHNIKEVCGKIKFKSSYKGYQYTCRTPVEYQEILWS